MNAVKNQTANVDKSGLKTNYEDLQRFQTVFFTSKKTFANYTNFEINKYGYILLNNIAKGFPALADIINNLKGFDWNGISSPNILKSLQTRFVNNYVQSRIPQFIYFKNQKPTKQSEKVKVSKRSKDLLDFDNEIANQIKTILQYDSKTYELLKYTERVQFLGKQILGEFIQKEKLKSTRKKKSIKI